MFLKYDKLPGGKLNVYIYEKGELQGFLSNRDNYGNPYIGGLGNSQILNQKYMSLLEALIGEEIF